jgi:hypothetical protein
MTKAKKPAARRPAKPHKPTGRPRGRPRKNPLPNTLQPAAPTRPRGRPRKVPPTSSKMPITNAVVPVWPKLEDL